MPNQFELVGAFKKSGAFASKSGFRTSSEKSDMATRPISEMSTSHSILTISTTPNYPPFISTATIFLIPGPIHSFTYVIYLTFGFRTPGVVQLAG